MEEKLARREGSRGLERTVKRSGEESGGLNRREERNEEKRVKRTGVD